jgi:hypothetical protein
MIHDPWYKNWEEAMKKRQEEIGKLLNNVSISHGSTTLHNHSGFLGLIDEMGSAEKPVNVENITDPVIEALKKEFDQRSFVGIKKYGTTLHDNNEDDFLIELHHELMDACAYIMKLRMQRNK